MNQRAIAEGQERRRIIRKMLCAGHTNKEIADHLELTEGAVKRHMSILFKQYGVKSRMSLVLRHLVKAIDEHP